MRGEIGAALQAAGTVLHHCLLYVRAPGGGLSAHEFGPEGDQDITASLAAAAAPEPVLLREAPPLEPGTGPALLLAGPRAHHGLDSAPAAAAVAFVQSRAYHAMLNNCIATADFLARALTGGSVRGVPLLYDLLCGQVC